MLTRRHVHCVCAALRSHDGWLRVFLLSGESLTDGMLELGMPLEKSDITPNSSGAKTPAELHEAGLAHMQAGRPLDAQGCCQQALAIDPHHADSLHLLGLLSLHAKQYDHAVEW